MNEKSIPAIQRPKMDYQPVFDVISAIFAYPAVDVMGEPTRHTACA